LVALESVLTGTGQMLSNEISPEEQEMRDDDLSVSPELVYSAQVSNRHPKRGGLQVRFEPSGQVLRSDVSTSPSFSMQDYPAMRCPFYLTHASQLATNSIRLGPTKGPANRAAKIPAQGREHLVPRSDIYHRKVVLPHASSGAFPALEDTPGNGLRTQLL
jgi:hypothetical protein